MRVEEKDQGQTATTLCQTDCLMIARCLMAKSLAVTKFPGLINKVNGRVPRRFAKQTVLLISNAGWQKVSQ
jgi:hypothetical protein